ncbi:hypothetical protein ABT173_28235 [Streptomyces sp. NPDC001795]|uniref:hypothetical protein n=1 Tax=unclassified Streptomyces TaxID=2593676 RepID=UPI003327DEDE
MAFYAKGCEEHLVPSEEACMAYVRCPNCGDTMQYFRDLQGDAEKKAAEEALKEHLEGRPFVAQAYHRCDNGGCRRVQRKDHWKSGATLPEGF